MLCFRACVGGALAVASFMVRAPTYTFTPIDDQIVGFLTDGTFDQHGFLDALAAFTSVDVPIADIKVATGINAPEQIVEYYDDGATHGLVDPLGFLTAI